MSLFDLLRYSSLDLDSEEVNDLPADIFDSWMKKIRENLDVSYTVDVDKLFKGEPQKRILAFWIGYGSGINFSMSRTEIILNYKNLLNTVLKEYDGPG